ncbi:MAG: hypothetical protein ABI725_09005 [Chloroflexota bacterium]
MDPNDDLLPLAIPVPDEFFEQFQSNGNWQYAQWPLPVMELVGARFKHGRRQAALTQRQVADRAQIS